MVALNFVAAQHTPKYGGDGALPAGKYTVVISETAAKATKDNTGMMLVLELRVVDGPLAGQTHTDRLNIYNTSAVAVTIANNALAAYMAVMGIPQIADTQELCNRPFVVEIGLQKDGTYTEVKKLFDINGNPPDKAGQAPQVQNAPPPQAPSTGFAPTSPTPTQAPNGFGAPAPASAPAWPNNPAPAATAAPAPAWPSPSGAAPATGAPPWAAPQ